MLVSISGVDVARFRTKFAACMVLLCTNRVSETDAVKLHFKIIFISLKCGVGSHSCLTREPLHGKVNQEVEFCSKTLLPIGKPIET